VNNQPYICFTFSNVRAIYKYVTNSFFYIKHFSDGLCSFSFFLFSLLILKRQDYHTAQMILGRVTVACGVD